MRIIKWSPILMLLFCSACSSVVIEEAENVRLDYWEKEDAEELIEQEYLDESNGLNVFADAVNSAEEMEEGKIITTRPVLSMEFMMENEENRSYHLWVTEDGEGYLQSLHPHKNATLRMDEESVQEVKDFIAAKDDVEVVQGEIEFEQ
ncbi:hypothetical protein [Planococcus halotolerans]|uniref:YhfM-like domain-containing protein n=1 Tax=Planococcus halotolerans TaxID=2233542 RepID=A0A365L747_9BACL|nr:hypothetical protein [Planococcus halotolerans]QHJ70077.1 hypothetical protein DNR44_005460 [Planococcus halotolerans]RAZ81205.1 hypothetical protein DP120_02655 [Planococcus halotolerans]